MNYECYIGSIGIFAGNFNPQKWDYCAGQVYAISDYTALFSIIGDSFGGDGRSTVVLPDLRGRVIVGEGSGPTLTPRFRGQMGGKEKNRLNVEQLAAHTHEATTGVMVTQPEFSAESTLNAFNGQDSIDTPGPDVILGSGHYAGTNPANLYSDAAPNTSLRADTVDTSLSLPGTTQIEVTVTNAVAGTNPPLQIDNIPPFTVVGYFICVSFGTYPSRN